MKQEIVDLDIGFKWRYENFPSANFPSESFPMKISQSEIFPKVKVSQVLNKE